MEPFAGESREWARVVFWGAIAFVAGQALHRRRALRHIMRHAPLIAGAAGAYLVGCFVGAALLIYFP